MANPTRTAGNKIKVPTELLELPDVTTEDGSPVYVEVQLVPMDQLVPILKGLPSGGATEDPELTAAEGFDRQLEKIVQWAGPSKELAKLGVMGDVFWYDEAEPDKFGWGYLTLAAQSMVIQGILRVSGWSGERTSAVRSFPAGDTAGGSNGNATVASVAYDSPPVAAAVSAG